MIVVMLIKNSVPQYCEAEFPILLAKMGILW